MENPKYENRFNVLPLMWRHEYIENLYEPFKIRGKRSDVFKDYPKLKDSNGNDTTKLNVSYDDKYHNGQLMRYGNDERGFYAIFHPKKEEFDKQKAFALIEKISEDLSRLASLQDKYVMKGNSFEDLEKIETEITFLFNSIFNQNNSILQKPVSNPYPRMFVSDFAFNLFQAFLSNTKKGHADCSFIYRIMYSDNLIFEDIRDSEYRRWLEDNHDIVIDKTKTLDRCTAKGRLDYYELLKQSLSAK
ncbi:MAG: hypothetical protein J0G96_02385 [Flavobacteriia bacterium]|uniref:hypothetical protein n=1 Tax=uncultured Flavobacterium sp. TaxID=165435 RepID=UPI00096988D3|nr:hypothetical protein [uncultured Flavobacterium sp.]MBN9292810.1 hypothetical protein [Flavobacteriia bacterium]OJX37098.1 MAG: hypothetical protein BGO87_15145 [Flavobacteriia bacterium 40-80]